MLKELVVIRRPKSNISEAIKTIRTNITFSSVDKQTKSILVVSSIAGEGKSFISANLAVAFAQVGNKVLIVDCDMRKGRQHNIFGIENKFGLSTLLLRDVKKEYKDCIRSTAIKNVSVLPMGIVPPNPSELLASEKNKQLTQILREEYDIIIYDGLPVCGLTDSIIMADLVDKIMIVSAFKQTPVELLRNTKKSLEPFKEKICGVILNKVKSKNSHYYQGYYTK